MRGADYKAFLAFHTALLANSVSTFSTALLHFKAGKPRNPLKLLALLDSGLTLKFVPYSVSTFAVPCACCGPWAWQGAGVCRAVWASLFRAVFTGLFTLFGLVFTVFIAGRASYSYAGFERPTELLVYSQGGQEAAYAAECISHIARDSGLGKNGLRIFTGESDNFAW